MKTATLSFLSYYKMSTEDVLHYLEAKGFDLDKEWKVHIIDDGAIFIYSQEEE